MTLADLLDQVDGGPQPGGALPTGFGVLDHVLEGGVRTGDLTLVGGAPGVGKTTTTLQWARNIALRGRPVVYACYEHAERALLSRLLHLEVGELASGNGLGARRALREFARGDVTIEQVAGVYDEVRQAVGRMGEYGHCLRLLRATPEHGLAELAELARFAAGRGVLFVDYLQRVPAADAGLGDEDRSIRRAEGLKEIALALDVAVVACAAGRTGLAATRMRAGDLRGAVGLAYEADLIIMLNDKSAAVCQDYVGFDTRRAEEYRRKVVYSVEKNREGPAAIDVEFEKDFEHFRLHPEGSHVAERLAGDLAAG